MPRQPRLDIPNVLHHVIVRGIEKRDIFAEDADRQHFVERLSSLLIKGSNKCFAWALMSNHVHLLLMPTTASLSETMRRLLTGYAVYFNRKYKRAGHLFQNRYKSILCEEEPYLLELVRYIHLNPLRAGLVKDLDELERYPWSGHGVLLGNQTLDGQVTGEVLSRFGNNKARSLKAYRQFIADGVIAGHQEELAGGGLKRSLHGCGETPVFSAYDERILGSGDFVESLTGGTVSREQKTILFSLDELVKIACGATDVDVELFGKPGKRRSVARARAIFCYLAVRENGYTGKEAGTKAGIGSAGVCTALQRGQDLMKEPSVRQKMRQFGILAN